MRVTQVLLATAILPSEAEWRKLRIERCLEEELEDNMQCTVLLFGQCRPPLRPGWLLLVASEGSVMAMSMGSLRSDDSPMGSS